MEKKQVKRVRNRAASVFVVKVEKVHEHVKMSVNESAFPGIIYPSVSSYSITSATTYRMPYTGERGATPIAASDPVQAATVVAAAVAVARVVAATVAVASGVPPAGQSAVGATAPAESQALG
jgi:hypothetical protein